MVCPLYTCCDFGAFNLGRMEAQFMIPIFIHFLLILLLPPLMLGVINKTKAWFAGRTGAPFFQPYYDLYKLFRKHLVLSQTTTWIFQAGPVVTLVAVFLAATLIPLGNFGAPVAFTGDMILFAYLFGLARFFTTSAALDTGSAFEGMGSARELTFAVLSEPAMFFAFLVLAKLSGSLSLTDMLKGASTGVSTSAVPSLVLIALGFFVVLLAETCRLPVDDPNTHLELTMIHEVMVLDHSGPLLGIVQYAAAMKLFIFSSILLQIVLPIHAGIDWIDWPLFVIELLGLAVLVGILESVMARLQIRRVPYLLVAALLLCGSGFILLLR